ncbi:MAG: molybdopterin molybdenumtransferase MoeA, partial [Actinomycetota bacterium]|nr:molybdopterin molybdenumtransferase MoeA [Actinomycetota bacterium]
MAQSSSGPGGAHVHRTAGRPGVMPWDTARRTAWGAALPLPPVPVPLGDAAGLALAGELWALAPLPAFDTAAMDGWAVRGRGPWRV